MAGKKGIDIVFVIDLPPRFPTSIRADAGRLRQVLVNLISNAIKFTPEAGKVAVRISCARTADDCEHGKQQQQNARDDLEILREGVTAQELPPLLQPDGSLQSTDVFLLAEVSDTGIGISKEGMQRLFQPFSQVDGSSTRVYGGAGLGLAISRLLVDLAGGVIGVQSAVGEGSRFWFTWRCRYPAVVSHHSGKQQHFPSSSTTFAPISLLWHRQASNRKL